MRITETYDEERRRKKESGSTDLSSFPHSFPQGIFEDYSEIYVCAYLNEVFPFPA